MTNTTEDVREIISKMDIVESLDRPGHIKQAGKDIHYGDLVDDEFVKVLFRNAPYFYTYLRQIINNPQAMDIIDDAKSFLFQFENIAKENLEGSELVNLLESKTDGGNQ